MTGVSGNEGGPDRSAAEATIGDGAAAAAHGDLGAALRESERVRGSLEAAVEGLRAANAGLARDAFARWDAAAASHVAELERLRGEVADAQARAERAERSAWENDQWLQEERRRTAELLGLRRTLGAVARSLRPRRR